MANVPNKTRNTSPRTAQTTNPPSGTKANRKPSKAQKRMQYQLKTTSRNSKRSRPKPTTYKLQNNSNTLAKPSITPALTTKEVHHQCSEAIGDIIRKASHTLSDKSRHKENNSYDKSPKHYHDNLKIHARINSRARDQLRVTVLTNPNTEKLQTNPHEVISIVITHYELEQKRAT